MSKLLVIGGSPIVDGEIYSKVDPHFIIIGYHDGIFKDLTWEDPSYWNNISSILEDYYGKLKCVIIDGGSGSWLYRSKTNFDDIALFISLMLSENGFFIPDHASQEIAGLLVDEYNFTKIGFFYTGDPNSTYFDITEILYIYTRSSHVNNLFQDDALSTLEKRTIVRKTGAPLCEKLKQLIDI